MSKENIHLLYGPPASGKSTLAKEVSRLGGYDYVSVGELTRAEIASGSNRGRQLQECLDRVVEYPAELIGALVEERLLRSKNSNGLILDGFPKYLREAEAFIIMTGRRGFRIESVIIVEISLAAALARVVDRRICNSCLEQTTIDPKAPAKCSACGGQLVVREDDKPEILTRRYGDFREAMADIKGALESVCTNIAVIDGNQSRQEVVSKALKIIDHKPE